MEKKLRKPNIAELSVALNNALKLKRDAYEAAANKLVELLNEFDNLDYIQIEARFSELDDIYNDMHQGLDFITFSSSIASRVIQQHLALSIGVIHIKNHQIDHSNEPTIKA
jgi:hypothetical protein